MESSVDMLTQAALKAAFAIRHSASPEMVEAAKPLVTFTELRIVRCTDGDFLVTLRRGYDAIDLVLPPDDFRRFVEQARALLLD